LCAEFDSVGQLFLIRQGDPGVQIMLSLAPRLAEAISAASNSVVNAALYGRLQ
jgi:hypothetical protein